MGGYGSGRFRAKKACVEDTPSVSVAWAARECLTQRGGSRSWYWQSRPTALTIALPPAVELVARRLRTGGAVWHFVCPAPGCGRRARKLYKPEGFALYACRRCHNLTYRSCQRRYEDVCAVRRLGFDSVAELRELRDYWRRTGQPVLW